MEGSSKSGMRVRSRKKEKGKKQRGKKKCHHYGESIVGEDEARIEC